MARLALFDFDGTITDRDSFADFIRWSFGLPRFMLALVALSPVLLLYVVRIMSNYRAKEIVVRWFFRGMPVDVFRSRARRYVAERLPRIMRPVAMEHLHAHRAAGDRICVVTASPELTLSLWCRVEGLELVATRLEERDGVLTGRIEGRNCFGPEKTRRLRMLLDPEAYEHITAYGDSRGDREMLALAHEAWYRWKKIKG